MEEKNFVAALLKDKQLSTAQLSQYLLAQDHLYRKISLEQQADLIAKAIQCGQAAAADFSQRLPEYLQDQGIIVEPFSEETKKNQFNFVLAEFQLPNKIRLNERLINEGAALIARQSMLSFFTAAAPLTDILLAHEIFHYIEHQQQLFTLQRQLNYKTGPFKRQARVYALSEIAAGSFVKSLLQLDFHPLLLNPLLIYSVDPEFSYTLLTDFEKHVSL